MALRDAQKCARVQGKHGYFNVDPLLSLPQRSAILHRETLAPLAQGKGGVVSANDADEKPLQQDGIILQSFVAKWAGSLSEWAPHLDYATACGYNMLHFTPLQVRGSSNSPYSIADQTDFASDLFDTKAGPASSKQERFATMGTWIERIRKQWGMLSMIDVVLNHTANNSEWLNEHPEAG